MKLTTKGRYGIHAMYDLALTSSSSPQTIRAIAERQNISETYLEQLIITLRKSGLVKSVRGAQGGYLLARDPGGITVGEVLRALEGELAFVDCLADDDPCSKSHTCPTRLVWQKVHEGLNSIVDGITLQDMLDDYARMTDEYEKETTA